MAVSSLTTASQVQKWVADYFAAYVRDSGFKPYMGRGQNSIINVKMELTPVGKTINIPLIAKLSGAGVSGQTALEGAEEVLNNYNHQISIDWVRNGVLQTEDQLQYTEMDLLKASREMLKLWSMERLRTDIITGLLDDNKALFLVGFPLVAGLSLGVTYIKRYFRRVKSIG